MNKEDYMVFRHHKIFQASVGYLFIIKGGFILVAIFFKIIIIHIYVSVPQKLRVSEYQIFSVQVRMATYTSYLKNVHLE